MKAIVLASGNKGKIREFSTLLEPFGVQVRSLSEFPEIGDIPETGETFVENAFIKARTVAEKTGLVAVADDSGIEVDALDGRPGVYSARYSGPGANAESNNELLLKELAGVPDEKRTARFRCVMAAVAPNGAEISTEGAWEGRIAHGYSGTSGFGYDPLFFDPEFGMTSAEMTPEQKNSRSHRGKAIRKLLELWPDFAEKAGL